MIPMYFSLRERLLFFSVMRSILPRLSDFERRRDRFRASRWTMLMPQRHGTFQWLYSVCQHYASWKVVLEWIHGVAWCGLIQAYETDRVTTAFSRDAENDGVKGSNTRTGRI